MPAPTPVPIRRALWLGFQQGMTTAELSRTLGLPPRTVRGLLQRYHERGEPGVAPDHAPKLPVPAVHPAYLPATQLRRDHPGWGAGLIRVYLDRQGVTPLPAARTLQRWFRRVGLAPASPGQRPASDRRRASGPHEVWQVDAAEEIPLGDGTRACWLRIDDEFSGAVLRTAVFPPRTLERCACVRFPGATAERILPLGAAPSDPRR